ncbi:BTAD domain-containing putative transcriptional regulator [Streptomyces sp. NPDC058231]|uniref:AfsR/SARP family transcriptional regulator n=1 Tax=unclassified Streptomyces TaxID=2593676 RepID=UPI0036F18DF4
MSVQLLGPVALMNGDSRVLVRGQRQLRFLATLALRPGQVVSKEILIEESWDGEPPRTVSGQLQTSVWMIRGALRQAGAACEVLTSHDLGYQLLVSPCDVDVFAMRETIQHVRSLFGRRDFRGAADELDTALGMWRGSTMAGVTSSRLRLRAGALDRERMAAVELRALIDIELGRFDDAIARLTELTEQEPLREDLYVGLMRAYYAVGRQADAIQAFHRAKGLLREQIGIAPGEKLRRVMQAVLQQDEKILNSY